MIVGNIALIGIGKFLDRFIIIGFKPAGRKQRRRLEPDLSGHEC